MVPANGLPGDDTPSDQLAGAGLLKNWVQQGPAKAKQQMAASSAPQENIPISELVRAINVQQTHPVDILLGDARHTTVQTGVTWQLGGIGTVGGTNTAAFNAGVSFSNSSSATLRCKSLHTISTSIRVTQLIS